METDRVERVGAQLVVTEQHVEQVELHSACDVDDFVLTLTVGPGLECCGGHRAAVIVDSSKEGEVSDFEGVGSVEEVR